MAQNLTVKARIEAEDKASSVVKGVESSFAGLGSTLKTFATGAVVAAGAAFAGFIAVMKGAVDAASEAEDATKRLENALAPLGSAAGEAVKQLEAQATALQQVTRYDDDAIKSGQALLASYIKNTDALKAATQAAVDFSVRTGSLESAFSLIAKAAAGNTDALGRYGVVLDEGIPKAERFEAVLAKINETFGGRAAADAQTYSGAIAKLGNSIGELQEQLGDGVVKSKEFNAALAELNRLAQDPATVKTIQDLALVIGALASGSANAIQSVAGLGEEIRTLGEQGAINLATPMNEAQRSIAGVKLAAEQALAPLSFLTDTLRQQGIVATEMSEAQAKAAKETQSLATNFTTLGQTIADPTSRMSLLASAAERTKRILGENVTAAEGFKDAVKALGVTLESDVNAAIETNNDLLLQAEDLYRRGLITRRDFENTELGVARAIDETRAKLEAQGSAFGDAASSTDAYLGALGRIAQQAGVANAAVGALTDSLTDATLGGGGETLFNALQGASGGSGDVTIRNIINSGRVINPAGASGLLVLPNGRIVTSLGSVNGSLNSLGNALG